MARKYSRLSRRLETQGKRNLVLSIIGIAVIMFLMVRFGIPLLANFAGFISGFNKTNTTQEKNETDFVSPPILDPLPSATNKPELEVKGQASQGEKVSVYLNGVLADTKNVDDDGSFKFKIFLKEGENKIKAKASMNNVESDYSDEEIITYKEKEPTLEIKSPSDGQKFEKDQSPIQVTGTTDEGVRVTVNDFWAIMNGVDFSYTLTLQNGENIIKVVATDEAGNKTEKTMKVTFSP